MPPTTADPIRLAMWSGPRNISTAMMRSWEARGDAAVSDEPLYAHYLVETGLDHPGRDEILAAHDADWRRVTDAMIGPVPGERPVWYQKHMSHHLLPDVGRDWLDAVTQAFLVRDPASMVVSLARALGRTPAPEETGLPQQLEMFERAADAAGAVPPVLDAADVLSDPAGTLEAFCRRVDVPWTPRMLAWEPGPRETDGAWASHWYATVEASTGFGPPREPLDPNEVPPELRPIVDAVTPAYERMRPHRVTADGKD